MVTILPTIFNAGQYICIFLQNCHFLLFIIAKLAVINLLTYLVVYILTKKAVLHFSFKYLCVCTSLHNKCSSWLHSTRYD